LGRLFGLPANWFLNGCAVIDGVATFVLSRRSLNHNVIQGLCGEIMPAPHPLRRNTNYGAFAYWKCLVIDLEFSLTLEEDVDLFVEFMPVVKRHGSFRRKFVE
jgi:hypothetical protein